jgi:hypothetical protein
VIESLVQFPALRTPSEYVVRGLREIDPTADLVYFGRGRWILGSVRPDVAVRAQAERILDRAYKLAAFAMNNPRFKVNPGNIRRLLGRIDFAYLGLQGFRFIHEYRIQGSPDSAIVEDFRRADWMHRNTSDAEFERLLDAPKEQARAEARADLADAGRARDAWRYCNVLNTAPGIQLDSFLRAPRSSARTLQRTIR